jgi:hypothetical protein
MPSMLQGNKTNIVDAALADMRPFGSSSYIREQMQYAFIRRLNQLADSLSSADELRIALARADEDTRLETLSDTALRCSIQHALRQTVTRTEYGIPLDECEAVFAFFARCLEASTPTDSAQGSGQADGGNGPGGLASGKAWTDSSHSGPVRSAFIRAVRHNYEETPAPARSRDIEILCQGERLLREALPRSADSALSHVRTIVLFAPEGNWAGTGSSSTFSLPGTIFLNRELVRNPWWVAEHLYHEALHQKLYDFRMGHSLLQQDVGTSDDSYAPIGAVWALWNSPGQEGANRWDTHRAMAAFHVYVHLALLCLTLEERATQYEADYGQLAEAAPPMTSSAAALSRARYLGEKIRESCWADLGPAGRRLVDWLESVLNFLDTAPPPTGAYLHLLLWRYEREADKVERVELSPQGARVLSEAIEIEMRTMRSVSDLLELPSLHDRLDAASVEYEMVDPIRRFQEIRRLISHLLKNMSGDGYLLPSRKSGMDPNRLVQEMVEESSRKLSTV